MSSPCTLRHPVATDAADIAAVHVRCWQETYRGTMRDEVLDDPQLLTGRERMWSALLSDPQYASVAISIATHDDEVIGFASAGPSQDGRDEPALQLHTLYVLRSAHGSGAGAALLDAVLGSQPAQLWVADPNPRAQAFYRKHGFTFDGTVRVDDGLRELSMTRLSQV